ncbi:TetR/AcrR family transcriptional regulator [Streptomyces sp. NPDC001054]
MARWEPNARERLVVAALDLFAEQGYDATTVRQIADRAGLTRTTFFRHFPDKREVLFAGQDTHARLLSEAIGTAPGAAGPLEAVGAGLDALAASFPAGSRDFGARLLAVVAHHPELRERAAFKHAGLAGAMAEALRTRGVPEPSASLAAELGARAFDTAYARWTAPDNAEPLGLLAGEALTELRDAAAALA